MLCLTREGGCSLTGPFMTFTEGAWCPVGTTCILHLSSCCCCSIELWLHLSSCCCSDELLLHLSSCCCSNELLLNLYCCCWLYEELVIVELILLLLIIWGACYCWIYVVFSWLVLYGLLLIIIECEISPLLFECCLYVGNVQITRSSCWCE